MYRWQDEAWVEFPNLLKAEYALLVGRSGPNFNPTGMLVVSASTGETESAIAGITVESSQRDPDDKPWWWLRGDTYPNRAVLKRWGCRWSKRQKAWYFIGWQLPDAVQTLIDAQNTSIAHENSHFESSDKVESSPVEEPSAISEVADVQVEHQPETVESAPVDEPEEQPSVRIIKPVLDVPEDEEPDAVITAIRQTKSSALSIVK